MKKILSLVLLFVLSFNIIVIGVCAENYIKDEAEEYKVSPMKIEVECNSALLMDAKAVPFCIVRMKMMQHPPHLLQKL